MLAAGRDLLNGIPTKIISRSLSLCETTLIVEENRRVVVATLLLADDMSRPAHRE